MLNNGIRLTYEYVKDYFKLQGCELLEDQYKNARTKMRYRCSCGREAEIVFYSFQNGNRCRQCGNRKIGEHFKKNTTESLKPQYLEQGCELLGEYVHAREPMQYRCKCGSIAMMSWNNFQKGKRCWQCAIERRAIARGGKNSKPKNKENIGKGRPKGDRHYEWKTDRERKMMEYRYRQSVYRIAKVLKRDDIDGRLTNIETNFGYTIDQFVNHAKSFPAFKTNNWEIDHIFPVWAFLEAGVRDPKIIHSLDNLQVISLEEHQAKAYKFNPLKFVKHLKNKGIQIEV